MMDENRLDNIVECSYNMDNGYVEVWYVDGNMLRIKCEEVEVALRTTEQSLAKLHKLLDNKPIEYVAMALSGEMQAYCDIEDEMVKGFFGTSCLQYISHYAGLHESFGDSICYFLLDILYLNAQQFHLCSFQTGNF